MEGTASRSESLLRPREIQVRIRSGQSPETVAEAAQTSVDRVMAYATPVLAERAFVAQQAAKASVRRRAGENPLGPLGDAVTRQLDSEGLDPESADWDAWRREDGRWTVVVVWVRRGEQQQATFTYDAIGRYVLAEDDPARWLVGERRAAEPARHPAPASDPLHGLDRGPALGSGPEAAAGQLALGDDTLRMVTGRPLVAAQDTAQNTARYSAGAAAEAARADAEPTEDLTETVRAVRAVGTPAPPDSETPAAEGDGLFEDAGLRTESGGTPDRRAARPVSGARSRRSMPSWDDIMLGSAPKAD